MIEGPELTESRVIWLLLPFVCRTTVGLASNGCLYPNQLSHFWVQWGVYPNQLTFASKGCLQSINRSMFYVCSHRGDIRQRVIWDGRNKTQHQNVQRRSPQKLNTCRIVTVQQQNLKLTLQLDEGPEPTHRQVIRLLLPFGCRTTVWLLLQRGVYTNQPKAKWSDFFCHLVVEQLSDCCFKGVFTLTNQKPSDQTSFAIWL